MSPQRLRAQIRQGRILASRVGRDWAIDPSALPKERRGSRPMSRRMAWAFIEMASGVSPVGLDPSEASRLRKRVARLRESENQASLLRDWLPARGRRICFKSKDIDFLRDEPRFLLSGLSLPESGLNGSAVVEAYVLSGDLHAVIARHMLRESSPSVADVVLHEVDSLDFDPHMPALIAADLAMYDDQHFREDARVEAILKDFL